MARRKKKSLTDDQLLQSALRQLSSAEKHMDEIMERVRRARLVCLGKTNPLAGKPRDPEDPLDWRSRLFPPVANEQWELLNTEMTVDDPSFSFTAETLDSLDAARVAEDALDYYHDRDRFGRLFRRATRAATRDGGAVIKTLWGTDFNSESGRLKHILCRLEDIFSDPTAKDFPECRFVFHRTYATFEDLSSRMEGDKPFYKNLDQLEYSVAGGADSKDERRDGETEEAFIARTTGVHTVHERWTPWGRLTIADRSVVIRRDDEPVFDDGVPFTMIRIIEDEDCIIGVSPMTLIDDTQEAFWRVLNDLIDAISLATNPPMLVDIDEDENAMHHELYPGARIPARNGEQTVKVIQDIASLDKYNPAMLMETLRSIMERLTGMNSAIAGLSQANTATQAAIDVRQGKGRAGTMISVADDCWTQLALKAYSTIRQLASEEVKALLSDGRQVSFVPEELQPMLITPSPASNERTLKDLQRQDAQSYLDSLMQLVSDPMSQLPQVDVSEAVKNLVRAFGGKPDAVVIGPPMGLQQQAPAGGMNMPMALDEAGNPLPPEEAMALMDPAAGVM